MNTSGEEKFLFQVNPKDLSEIIGSVKVNYKGKQYGYFWEFPTSTSEHEMKAYLRDALYAGLSGILDK